MALVPLHNRASEWQRIRRFLVVGLSSTLLDVALLTALKTAGLATLPANSLAYGLATIYNFAVSRAWTYASARNKPAGLQFGLFVTTSLLGLLLNDAMVVLLEAPIGALLGDAARGYLPAKALATVAVAAWSYITNRLWVFGDRRPKQLERS